jgi:hypothetical protein
MPTVEQLELVRREALRLVPALAGLGLEADTHGMSMLMNLFLDDMAKIGLDREFCYRVIVGALAMSLGHHAQREGVDGRLAEVFGEGL